MTETHLKDDNEIFMPVYYFIGLNRKTKNSRGSGGICILFKNKLKNLFYIETCLEINNDVIGIKITNRESGLFFNVYCIYLPPESSKYGQNNENILNELCIEMYRQSDSEAIYICGDFNARLGDKQDCAEMDIPQRQVLDATMNSQGSLLLTFLNDICGCILNGRITPKHNNYTSTTSYRGCSVIDYHIARVTDLNSVIKMSVISCMELVDANKINYLINDNSKLPDHNLLTMEIELLCVLRDCLTDLNIRAKNQSRNAIYRKVGDNYMKSDTAERMLPLLLQDSSTKFKPYWDIELSASWKKMSSAEHQYRKACKICESSTSINKKKLSFKSLQNAFDKLLKKKKRQYQRGLQLEIEKQHFDDPS